jgi:nucleotide-binding universal stress UspA family protein
MFGSVLVPLDGSPFAEHALPLARAVARRAGAELDLVRVHGLYALKDPAASWCPYDPAQDAECRREEEAYLANLARRLREAGPVRVSTAVVPGLVADGILGRAKDRHADLVVMTTHGVGPVSRFFLGSVADELVRRATAPLLLVRPPAAPPDLAAEPAVRHVLVPLDGSGLSEQVVEPAVELANVLGARLTLLRVVEPHPTPGPGPAEEASAYLEGWAGRLRGRAQGVRARVVAARHAASAILEEARSADLVALSTHGRGGVRRLLLGSVADKVLRGAAVPVLVCRPAGGEGRP